MEDQTLKPTAEPQKPLWVDESLHLQVKALADFERRSIKSVVEHMIKKQLRVAAEKND
jgi:hypothetical protein